MHSVILLLMRRSYRQTGRLSTARRANRPGNLSDHLLRPIDNRLGHIYRLTVFLGLDRLADSWIAACNRVIAQPGCHLYVRGHGEIGGQKIEESSEVVSARNDDIVRDQDGLEGFFGRLLCVEAELFQENLWQRRDASQRQIAIRACFRSIGV